MRKFVVAAIIGSVLLSGCMSSMTPEQQQRVRARMAEPAPQSASTFLGVPRDRDELIKHGEVY